MSVFTGCKGTAIFVPIQLISPYGSILINRGRPGATKPTIFHNWLICPYYLSATNYKPLNLQLQQKKFFTP